MTAPAGTDASSHVTVLEHDLVTMRPYNHAITHVFSFWEGMTPDARKGVARICCASSALESVAVVQRAMRLAKHSDPVEVMRRYGFPRLRLVTDFAVTSVGSGRQYVAYVYERV
jgi:hypothetical protein